MRGLSHAALQNPEMFSSKSMLYIPGTVAGVAIELFVDTGAQSSVVSECMVRQLKRSHRVDRTYRGQARGVGKANITGMLCDVPVSFGSSGVEFKMAFLVLACDQPMLIMGLDQMRKYRCLVDLDRNELVFGGQGGIAVKFVERPLVAYPPHRPEECCIS